MYTAKEIAEYIISQAIIFEKPIESSRYLSRVLYQVWVDYYKLTGKFLFNDEFFVWSYGCTIPNLHILYTSNPDLLRTKYSVNVRASDIKLLNEILTKYLNKSFNDLVQADLFAKSKNKTFSSIAFQEIISKECIDESSFLSLDKIKALKSHTPVIVSLFHYKNNENLLEQKDVYLVKEITSLSLILIGVDNRLNLNFKDLNRLWMIEKYSL